MAVTKSVIKATLKGRLAILGVLTEPGKQDDFADAMADWIVSDVVPLLQIAGATGTGTPGGPLPIALPPGTVT